MAVLPDFEYDIFISYRHNDNRSGWVTEFVNALQEELAATIKEPLSIYFDKNPHDGLLETHNVDKSLEGKLKCLIFIPIISQTYCDTKSFAWEHEFCAFNKLAKEAPPSPLERAGVRSFGRDIKLSNGNVASRILPIKIHDLDAEDKSIIENEIGGVLRAIEFIYKEAGVNRPLLSNDSLDKNLNKTSYRNQVNKVANAVKEIITSLKNPTSTSTRATGNDQPSFAKASEGKSKNKLILVGAVALLLLAVGYFVYSKVISATTETEAIGKSIAVLPFENMSGDAGQEYFSDGIAEEIINSLAQVKELKVAGRTSSFHFKGKNPDLNEVRDKLGVETVLQGSVRKQGERLRITVQLTNVSDGYTIWSERFERNISDAFAIQDEIATAVTNKLKLSFVSNSYSTKIHEPNQKAYELYLKGRYFWNKRGKDLYTGLDYFNQAVAADSLYALAHAGVALSYVLIGAFDMVLPGDVMPKARKAAEKAIQLDANCADAYAALGYEIMLYEWNWSESERMFLKSIAINPKNGTAHSWYSSLLGRINQFDRSLAEAKKGIELEPLAYSSYYNLTRSLINSGKYPEALKAAKQGLELNKIPLSFSTVVLVLEKLQRFEEAIDMNQKGLESAGRDPRLLRDGCRLNFILGRKAEALALYQELKKRSLTEYISPFYIATAAYSLNLEDEAIRYFKKSIEDRARGFALSSELLPPKDNARYRFIYEALKLPE